MNRMKNKNKTERQDKRLERTRQRADSFFWIYYHIGTDRSLDALCDFAAGIGMKRARSTFARWSIDYSWQNRIIEIDTKLKEERDQKHMAQIEDMNLSQAKDARNMRAIARAGMSAYARMIQSAGVINLSPQDIAVLMREGTKIERLAMGEATDRLESVLYIWNVMVYAIGEIFNEVNAIKSSEERARIYGQKVDELRHTKLIDFVKPEEGG